MTEQKNTHPVVFLLEDIRKDYIKNRFTFIEGTVMIKILRYFGASDYELRLLEKSGGSLLNDPTLPFRKSRNGRFLIDFKNNTLYRLAFQPFILHKSEDFIRYDSDNLRLFRGIQDDI